MGRTFFEAGQTVAARYRLDHHLGSGSSAEVWCAFDATLRAPVALKLLNPGYAGTPLAARFLREARAAAQLRSLHVVQILDQGVHEDSPYIAMELLEGETLADRIDRERSMSPVAVCRVLGQVAKAASKGHAAGVIHRDLKPPNVFLVRSDDGDDEAVKVFDFGIAKIRAPPGDAAASTSTMAGTLLGTPEYMSPEQATGAPIDYRTDIYAMGIMAMECLTGHVPFRSNDLAEILEIAALGQLLRPSELAPVPPGFDAWFARATSFRVEDRFGSAKELAEALRECLLGE